jgi:hypothetical protein
MWIHFLLENKGALWKNFFNIKVLADVSTDASGRSFAGVVDLPSGTTRITSGEISPTMQHIQIKEGEALRATLSMMVKEMSHELYGKTLICKVDNQALMAVLERKGTSHNLALNTIGKQMFWLQDQGQFHLALEYVESKKNVADKFTRQSPGLEASITPLYFKRIWDNLGPFSWDLMASSANVNRDFQNKPQSLKFFFQVL